MTADEVIGIVLEAEKDRGLSVDGRRPDCLIFRDRHDLPVLILERAAGEWRATFRVGRVHDAQVRAYLDAEAPRKEHSTAAQARAYLDAEELGGRYARKETRP